MASVTNYPYPPLDTGCKDTGQLTDWAAANGVSAVDVELTTHYSIDFEQNLRVLLFTFLYFQPGGALSILSASAWVEPAGVRESPGAVNHPGAPASGRR